MKNIVIGRYVPGNSFLYKMDPRTKIICMLLLMASAFIVDNIYHMLLGLAFVFFILLIGKISVKRVYLGLRPLMFLLIFTFTFQVLFNEQGELLFEEPLFYSPLSIFLALLIFFFWFFTKKYVPFKLLYFVLAIAGIGFVLTQLDFWFVFATGTFTVYQGGLELAFFIMIRLIILVTLSTILTITTKPTDLNLGLEHVLSPLRHVRINSEEIAMIISIALRYIPTLLDEANKIMEAQASRGVDFQEGKLKDKIMQVVSLLVPMFIISFKRSDELANAMEARSFVPGKPRTRLHILTWKTLDTLAVATASVIIVTTTLFRILL